MYTQGRQQKTENAREGLNMSSVKHRLVLFVGTLTTYIDRCIEKSKSQQ